ncbi:hypothetical protein FNF31_03499 [Cafeteria roenbergensis]|uniref:G-protein coupled receptors family 2 profile 2 domain-containing protein n=1 Tax=Cafeteria roenbergensis TaxID=33653 RepID=A0A5A8D8N6_CAFRO|nr:hypothetical protein FNF31_03499 [Cafeteria roenbergensis]KAA0168340.1 hypothetical protein FNF28_02500 [Cafeteria roenbergensis]
MDFAASAAFIGSMQLISGICGALSALGSLVLIVSFVVYSSEQWRSADGSASVERKVKALIGGYLLQVCFLAVSDLLVGVSWVLSLFLSPDTSPDDTLCVVQAWLLALTPLISAAWTACLATELLMLAINIRKEVTGSFARRRYWFYHASWVLPLALGIPLIPGPSRPMFIGGMCWLDDGLAGEQPFVWLYIPKLAVMAYVVGVYLRVSGHVCAADAASATVDVADEDLSAQGSRRHSVSRAGGADPRPLAPSPTAADGLLMDPGGGPAGGSPADPGRSGNGGGGMGSSVSSGGSGNGSRLGQWDSGDEEEEDDFALALLTARGMAPAAAAAAVAPARMRPVASQDELDARAMLRSYEAVGDDYGEALDFSFVAQPSDGSSLGGSGADEPMVRRSSAGSDWEFG